MPVTVVWFRRDLRLHDNEALTAACARSDAVVPVFVHPEAAPFAPGAASRAWLARSLEALDAELRARGGSLVVRGGTAAAALTELARETGADEVRCHRVHTPAGAAEEAAVSDALGALGVRLVVHEGQLLSEPRSLKTGSGGAFRVFTPYFRAWSRTLAPAEPLSAPSRIPSPSPAPSRGPDRPPATDRVWQRWRPGEAGALERLEEFAERWLADYARDRDRPDLHATSELSAHLAWGELSARQVRVACVRAVGEDVAEPLVRQLAWREFSYHTLASRPDALDTPLRPEFAAFPWCDDPESLLAWRDGMTGYPFVDAGMRQLRATGWMHNRARLVCSSFLVKDLLQRWQDGARHFEETLADFDPAINAFNWQWAAGSGADAAPYFRIFNPVLQGKRFDPHGAYVKEWVPELAGLEGRWLHEPFNAPTRVLAAAGVRLGTDYPAPIIDHAQARVRALAAFAAMRGAAPPLS